MLLEFGKIKVIVQTRLKRRKSL